MSKHTPGPWFGIRIGSGVTIDAKPGAHEHEVICVFPFHESPNVSLIAAAPELLEALKELVEQSKQAANWVPHVLLLGAIEAAEKVVAKAEDKKK